MKKYIETIKKSFISALVFWITLFWITYAVNIVSYTETANPWDTLTADWANSIKTILPIDSSKIVDESITWNDILNSSITSAELAPQSVYSDEIADNTITETDISDSFVARDSSKLWWVNSSDYALKSYVDTTVSNSWWKEWKKIRTWSSNYINNFFTTHWSWIYKISIWYNYVVDIIVTDSMVNSSWTYNINVVSNDFWVAMCWKSNWSCPWRLYNTHWSPLFKEIYKYE